MNEKIHNCDLNCINCLPQRASIFSGLSDEDMLQINANKSCVNYKKGEIIFSENTQPIGIFCVSKGKIKIAFDGLEGKEQILRFAKAGDIFGYRALIANDKYHCRAIAMEDAAVCVIDKDFFMDYYFLKPQLNKAVFTKLSQDLKKAENAIVSLSQKNVRERIAEALLYFIETYGYEEDGTTLNVLFSREEIAGFVGTSTESTIRLLSEFNHDGIIKTAGKKILIINLDRLKKTANMLY